MSVMPMPIIISTTFNTARASLSSFTKPIKMYPANPIMSASGKPVNTIPARRSVDIFTHSISEKNDLRSGDHFLVHRAGFEPTTK